MRSWVAMTKNDNERKATEGIPFSSSTKAYMSDSMMESVARNPIGTMPNPTNNILPTPLSMAFACNNDPGNIHIDITLSINTLTLPSD